MIRWLHHKTLAPNGTWVKLVPSEKISLTEMLFELFNEGWYVHDDRISL